MITGYRDKKNGEQLRASAVGHGIPPIVSLATQLSTKVWKNSVAYRASGPIPAGLYYQIINGQARPKPLETKAKSSTIGLQAGRAVSRKELGRYDLDKQTNEWKLRDQGVPVASVTTPLEASLRLDFGHIWT